MARVPSIPDLLRLINSLSERVRRLELRSSAHAEVRTFIVGGDLEPGLFVPWIQMGLDLDERSPETKELIYLRARTRLGEVTVTWELDDVEFYTGHVIGTSWSVIDLRAEDYAVLLAPGWHDLRPVITDGTCTDISGAYAAATRRR